MKGFKNVKAYIYGKGIITTDIAFNNGIIQGIGQNLDIDEVIACEKDAVVLPGFIDEHIHGASDCDAMDGNINSLETIANSLAKEGTTSFLATTMTQSEENITNALKAVDEYRKLDKKNGAEILGVHLEGPFISEKHIGAQPLKYLSDPKIEIFDKYYKASGNSIKIITLAPEERGGIELTKHASSLGVTVSAGHSDAGYNNMVEAVKNGLKSVTHTFNAQRGIHHREVGVAGSALLIDELNAEMICDLIHLSAPAIKLIVKNKPHDKVTLITDSMRAKYLEDGISELGGQKVIVKNGEARLENGALAGSILKMKDAIKNIVLHCDVPFTDAVDFATINPAKNLGVENKLGTIEIGKHANFALMSENFDIYMTIRKGEIIYKA